MNALLFDAQPDSVRLWREILAPEGLLVDVVPIWQGSQTVPANADLVILDQSTFRQSFVSEVLSLCNQRVDRLVIATGDLLSVELVVELMRSGVSCVFEKPLDRFKVRDTLPGVLETLQQLTQRRNEYKRLGGLFASVTPREQEVLSRVMNGVPNKDAAAELNVSVRTIESRRAKVYKKLESNSLAEVVRKIERLRHLGQIFGIESEQCEHAFFKMMARQGCLEGGQIQARAGQRSASAG